jgi:hypothetical protein
VVGAGAGTGTGQSGSHVGGFFMGKADSLSMSYDDIPVVAAEEEPDLMEEVPEVGPSACVWSVGSREYTHMKISQWWRCVGVGVGGGGWEAG